MKYISAVRNCDTVGRVTVPVAIRKYLNISPGDNIEVYTYDHCIILDKYDNQCIFCNKILTGKNQKLYKNKAVCLDCIDELRKIID